MREAERCTGVANAVFGAADGAAVLAERTPPFMGLGSRQVRSARGWRDCEDIRAGLMEGEVDWQLVVKLSEFQGQGRRASMM